MTKLVAILLLAACGDPDQAPPAPTAPTAPLAAAVPAPREPPKRRRTPLPTMSVLVDKVVSGFRDGDRAAIESWLFSDGEIRWACRTKPGIAQSVLSLRDRKGFSNKRPSHQAAYEACFAVPWQGAKHRVLGSLLGERIVGCTAEVVAIAIEVETAKGPYLLEIKDAVQIGGQAGLTTLPACKPAQ